MLDPNLQIAGPRPRTSGFFNPCPGYLCKFCELFCDHSSSSQEWPNDMEEYDPAKNFGSWFSREENIELSIYKLAYRRGH